MVSLKKLVYVNLMSTFLIHIFFMLSIYFVHGYIILELIAYIMLYFNYSTQLCPVYFIIQTFKNSFFKLLS